MGIRIHEVLGAKHDKRQTPLNRHIISIMRYSRVTGKEGRGTGEGGHLFDVKRLEEGVNKGILIGGRMENVDALLKKVNEEAMESSRILKDLWNDTSSTYDLLEPELVKMVKKIRDTRMTVTRELNQSLTIMRDVRKFFLESDYEREMERLERFVVLGERMKALMKDGTADAITDIMLKLADGGDDEEKGAD